jgi:hypothetical protein
MIWFREEQIRLPQARPGSEGREVVWQLATLSRVRQILTNPCYGGAFAFGRTGTKMSVVEGRAHRSPGRRYKAIEQWDVLILDHHSGYIGWEQYLKNRKLMAENIAQREGEGRGAAKKGSALLSGLLRCGRCGRKMQVIYSGRRGQVARYGCSGARELRGSSSCLSVGSLRTDAAVVEEVLQAIEPAGIEAALKASEQAALEDQERRRCVELALERARYEAKRAERQFDAVEPENRLVAGELEARWNGALAQVAELEGRLQELRGEALPLTNEQKRRLLEMGKDLRRLWDEPQAPVELKKRIVRTVVQEIVVNSVAEPAEHRLQIHWAGGMHTELRVARNKTGMHRRMASGEVIELVRELAKVCDDKTIAGVLNRLGFTTGQGNSWRVSRVVSFRHTHRIDEFSGRQGRVTLEEAARRLEVSHTAVKGLIRRGVLPARQVVQYAPWVIEEKALESAAVKVAIQRVHRGKKFPPTVAGQQELPIK